MSRLIPIAGASLALFPLAALAGDPAIDARNYPGPAWSPYIVGAGIGVLSWLTFYFSDKPIGASSFYAQVAGFIGKLFSKRHMESLGYFKENPPRVSLGICLRAGDHRRRFPGRLDRR